MRGRGAVLITGASRGIGEACALRLDRAGFRVFAGVRRLEDGDALRRKASDRLAPVRLDVLDPARVAAAAEEVRAAVGDEGLAGLVNNAGVVVAAPLEFVPLDEVRHQLEVNLLGPLALVQALLPTLRRARGRIVNIGSVAGKSALPFMGPYAMSKFALEALTDALRVELMPWDVRVAVVEPGAVATSIWRASIKAADELAQRLPPQARELYGKAMAVVRQRALSGEQRGIPAERVARAVEHALTADAPRTRYLLGWDSKLRLLLERLPDRLRDRVIAKALYEG